MRRLRVRPRQSNLRGPRETPPGPTTWVRPATGWWGRMNAGESPRNQGLSVKGAPVRFQKAVSRSKEKRRGEAPIGAPVRVMGRLFPSAEGTGFAARQANGCGDPHQRLSALCPLGAGAFPNGGRAPPPPERWSLASLDTLSAPHNGLSCPRRRASSTHQRLRLLDRPLSRAMTTRD